MSIFRKKTRAPEKQGRRRFFFRDRRGSVAIEFAMLVIPFGLLTFAILESCISFAASQLLTNATDNVARQLRTGQIKNADLTYDVVRAKLCDQIQIIVTKGCVGLKFDLRKVGSFKEAADLQLVFNGSGQDRELASSNFTFNPGKSMTMNTLRVVYEWPVITNYIASSLANLKGGKIMHYSSTTWRNEPFSD